MSDHLTRPPLVYGPGKRGAGYGVAVTGLVAAGFVVVAAWVPFSFWLDYGDTSALPLAAGLLCFALGLVALSFVISRIPLTPAVITLTDTGLVIDTKGVFAKPQLALDWAEIDRIALGAKHRGVQDFVVRPARQTGRKPLRLLNYQLGVPLMEIVQEIAVRAGAAGYRLEGGPLEEPALLTQKWRLVRG